MTIDPLMLAAWIAAAACAALMGFAIQRGATCVVAAVDEWSTQRRSTRLRALVEAALWVAGGLLVARALGALPHAPDGHALGGWTVAGAMLLGGGAWVNRACVFGAIARLGTGEWAYVATPFGFYAGCAALPPRMAMPLPAEASPVWHAPMAPLLAGFGAFAAWRVFTGLRAWRRGTMAWTPHVATTTIGLAFLAMLLLVGAWAYTDALAELAQGMAMGLAARLALFACLLAGALLGGWHAGRWSRAWPPAQAWVRCFIGGLLMGWGSGLIPGGNDGLILVGLPLGWPYAWVAFAVMVATVALAIRLSAAFRRPAPAATSERPSRAAPPAAG
jgi:toxin CptA